MDCRGNNHLYTILDHVRSPPEVRQQLNLQENISKMSKFDLDVTRTNIPIAGSITQPASDVVSDAITKSGKVNVKWREELCSTQSINKKPTSNTKELVITKLGPHDKIDSDRKSPPLRNVHSTYQTLISTLQKYNKVINNLNQQLVQIQISSIT